MSLRKTAAMLEAADRLERDLMAARTGTRKSYRPVRAASALNGLIYCEHCGTLPHDHVRESGILFCPENALRERYGR